MTKTKRAASPQMSFMDLDQNVFPSPTTKSVPDSRLSETQQETGARSPDQPLRNFTAKILSDMGVEPEEDLERSLKQAIFQRKLEEEGCPEKYVQIAAEEMKNYPDLRCEPEHLKPAIRRIRVFLLKQEHPDWLSVWTTAEQDIMSGKADLLDFHLHPINPDVFVKKMQEIEGNDFPQILLAYTCIGESEYDAVEKEWEKFPSRNMDALLTLYGTYRKCGRFPNFPSGKSLYLSSLKPYNLRIDSFPFRREDRYELVSLEFNPVDFRKLSREEASREAVHGENYVG